MCTYIHLFYINPNQINMYITCVLTVYPLVAINSIDQLKSHSETHI